MPLSLQTIDVFRDSSALPSAIQSKTRVVFCLIHKPFIWTAGVLRCILDSSYEQSSLALYVFELCVLKTCTGERTYRLVRAQSDVRCSYNAVYVVTRTSPKYSYPEEANHLRETLWALSGSIGFQIQIKAKHFLVIVFKTYKYFWTGPFVIKTVFQKKGSKCQSF